MYTSSGKYKKINSHVHTLQTPTLFSENKCPFHFILFYFSIIVVWVSWYYIILILTRSQDISCWLVLFDAWMKVLATPSSSPFFLSLTQRVCFKKGYYILAEAITLLSICIRIAHKSFDFGALLLMLWLLPTGKQIVDLFVIFGKMLGQIIWQEGRIYEYT